MRKNIHMDIVIRKLEKNVIAALDDLAGAQNKSRNEYLVEQITLLARYPELRAMDDRYLKILSRAVDVIAENNEQLKKLNNR